MKKIYRNIAALLSIIFILNIAGVSVVSASSEVVSENDSYTTEMQEYDRQLDEAYRLYLESESEVQPQFIGPVIGHILRYTMSQLAQRGAAVAVSTTARNVATRLTAHAIAEAVVDGITTAMIDNLLAGKSSGMNAIEKYYDIQTGARVAYDPNNKVIIIMDKDQNNMFTIYSDTGKNTIDHRVNITKRWWKSNWSFK